MTKGEALYSFFSSFGIPAYEETKVPETAEFPYITYQYITSALEEGVVNCYVNIYYRDKSNVAINTKLEAISNAIGRGGKTLPLDVGYIWIKRGSPFAQTIADEIDKTINRRYLNVELEYLS